MGLRLLDAFTSTRWLISNSATKNHNLIVKLVQTVNLYGMSLLLVRPSSMCLLQDSGTRCTPCNYVPSPQKLFYFVQSRCKTCADCKFRCLEGQAGISLFPVRPSSICLLQDSSTRCTLCNYVPSPQKLF